MKIQDTMSAFKEALNNDPDYAWSWQCNLAMTAYDEGLPKPKANRAAARFMKLAFDIDMTKHEHFADTQIHKRRLKMAEIDTVICSKDKLKEVFGIMEEVRAIETLEYHNKNHLIGSNESRSRVQIRLLTQALTLLGEIV